MTDLQRDESEAVVTALHNIVMPRLDDRDANVFATLIKDLWSHVTMPLALTGKGVTSQSEIDSRSIGRSSHDSRAKVAYGNMNYNQHKSFRGMTQAIPM